MRSYQAKCEDINDIAVQILCRKVKKSRSDNRFILVFVTNGRRVTPTQSGSTGIPCRRAVAPLAGMVEHGCPKCRADAKPRQRFKIRDPAESYQQRGIVRCRLWLCHVDCFERVCYRREMANGPARNQPFWTSLGGRQGAVACALDQSDNGGIAHSSCAPDFPHFPLAWSGGQHLCGASY